MRRHTAQARGVAIEFRICILNPETLSSTVQNGWRHGFGSGIGVLRPPRFLISLLVAGWMAIFLAGPAQAQTGTVAFGQSAYQADASQSNVTINIIYSGSTDATATVDFSTSDGTGVAGVDYVAVSNTVSFAAENPTNTLGPITNTVNVALLNNGVAGSTQTVNLALLNPTGPLVLGSPSIAVLTIINNEVEALQFTQASYSVDDTDSVAIITLVRIGATNGTVTVDFKTSDGSARAGIDYTATTGTVTFAGGVLTNTFTIPILPPGALETNQTVNLTLSGPTGGASLGSPAHAVLTIVATGPPVIQLSAAAQNVLEHIGHVTITAIRFGDSSTQDTVDYATSDGTASNGIDYFSTSGTLIFAPGVSRSSFSFSIQKFMTFQSNKTVNVTLSNPVGASLGPLTTAIVTIVNDRPQTFTFTNSGGGVVTLELQFAGTMSPSNLEPLDLLLSATDASTVLTIKVKKNRAGTGSLQIDQITGEGSCRLIDARDFDVVGTGIQLAGYLGQLKIHDLLDGASITANGSENQNTTVMAHNIDDDGVIAIGSRLKSLSAARFGVDATVDAPWIGTISIKGDKRNGIAGDCDGVITVSGDGIATNQLALAKLTVSGAISNASIDIANGSIGSVSAFQMINSSVFVGYTPDVLTNALLSGSFLEGVHLRTLSIRSPANGFVNSDVAATTIGNVTLSSVVPANGGLTFGIAASDHITSVNVRTPHFHWMPINGPVQTLGDFHVLLVP